MTVGPSCNSSKNYIVVEDFRRLICDPREALVPVGIYMFKVNNRNTRTRCFFILTIKTPERRRWRRSGVFIVNFKHISRLCSSVSIVNFEHVNADRGRAG